MGFTVLEEKRAEFEELSRPLIKFLNDNFDPHTQICIDTDHSEIVSGLMSFRTEDYIKD